MSFRNGQRLASVSLALVLAACLSRTVAETVTQRVGPPVRAVALELDTRGRYNVPEEDRPAIYTAITAGLARKGVSVVLPGNGAPLLSASVEEYRPVVEERDDLTLFQFDFGKFEATWRLTDPSGANLGEYRAGGTTSAVLGHEWGDVLQGIGEALGDFLLAS